MICKVCKKEAELFEGMCSMCFWGTSLTIDYMAEITISQFVHGIGDFEEILDKGKRCTRCGVMYKNIRKNFYINSRNKNTGKVYYRSICKNCMRN